MAERRTAAKATETIEKEKKIVAPIQIFNKEGGFEYLLEFDRDSVKFAENRGLKPQTIEGDLGMQEIEELFFCAFRKNHPRLSKAETDRILDKLKPLPVSMVIRLCELFELPYTELITNDENLERKNAELTVKF